MPTSFATILPLICAAAIAKEGVIPGKVVTVQTARIKRQSGQQPWGQPYNGNQRQWGGNQPWNGGGNQPWNDGNNQPWSSGSNQQSPWNDGSSNQQQPWKGGISNQPYGDNQRQWNSNQQPWGPYNWNSGNGPSSGGWNDQNPWNNGDNGPQLYIGGNNPPYNCYCTPAVNGPNWNYRPTGPNNGPNGPSNFSGPNSNRSGAGPQSPKPNNNQQNGLSGNDNTGSNTNNPQP